MEILVETWIKLGFTGLIVIFFLWMILKLYKSQENRLRDANKIVTKTNEEILGMFKDQVQKIAETGKETHRVNKDIAVIQAQILDKLQKHDTGNRESWQRFLPTIERICDNMNGKNPAIKKIQEDIAKLKETIKKPGE
jgi:chromosome segregation ATPase